MGASEATVIAFLDELHSDDCEYRIGVLVDRLPRFWGKAIRIGRVFGDRSHAPAWKRGRGRSGVRDWPAVAYRSFAIFRMGTLKRQGTVPTLERGNDQKACSAGRMRGTRLPAPPQSMGT